MDRLGERGIVFDNCWCGSTPCMPARRDIYTGRYEFLERGWGPLEDDDPDLPRQISGPPNRSIAWSLSQGFRVSYLITDHFHLWEQGSGNYHMGYTGFDFIRGVEADAYATAPAEFPCPAADRLSKLERHWRNAHVLRQNQEVSGSAQVISRACTWLEANQAHQDFYLHLDIFDPHEPWDPPESILRQFDPRGYAVPGLGGAGPYAPWRGILSEGQLLALRARYAAKVVALDRQLGRLFDTLDRLGLWRTTLVILTADHGTFNGDHGRMGKLQTHEHDAVGHIPLVVAHPDCAGGQHRPQLVQLVDLYPTVLAAVGRPVPEMPPRRPLHGINLLPVLADARAATRPYALCGQFGASVTLTDGEWILHQSPVPENQPLHWYGHCLARFLPYDLGPYEAGRRPVRDYRSWPVPTWLSDKRSDPNELSNLAQAKPEKLRELQRALRQELVRLQAPPEQSDRLGLRDLA
jgi:arylsulfatase A-like enzyme